MPADPCKAERAAFESATQELADAEAAFYIATQNLEAAIWGNGASEIKSVKEVMNALNAENADKVAGAMVGLMEAYAGNQAAQARLRGAKAAYDVATMKRQKARNKLAVAQQKLLDCLKRHKPKRVWSGTITITTTGGYPTKQTKGETGIFRESLEKKAVRTWQIIGPTSSTTDSQYLVRWIGTVDGTELHSGTPYDPKSFTIYTTTSVQRGFATGVATAQIYYSPDSGLSFQSDSPMLVPGAVLTTITSNNPQQPFERSAGSMTIGEPTDCNGAKLKDKRIKGSKKRRETEPYKYEIVTAWDLTVAETRN